jgi:phosphoglycolate phosphatase
MTRLLILDLDGTLVDSLPDLTAAANDTRAGFGLPPLSSDGVRQLVGEGAQRLVERALPGLTPAQVAAGLARFLDYNRDHVADRAAFYPGVLPTLTALRDRGTVLAVVSNKNEQLCRDLLRILGGDHLFAAILGADSLPERKPSPLPLRHLMARFGTAPDETVMVGDGINDFLAGRAAGVRSIGCPWGYGGAQELAQADLLIASFPELATVLGSPSGGRT